MSAKHRPIRDDGDLVVTRRELHHTLAQFAKLADAAMERKVASLLHSLRQGPPDAPPDCETSDVEASINAPTPFTDASVTA